MLANGVVFSILILCLRVNYVQPMNAEPSNIWDLLIYTQQWPPTVCKEWKHNPVHSCSMPSKHDTWTIHGIWPTKLGTRGPEFCNRTWHFDPEAIRPIEEPLTELWTNIESGTSAYSFWAHEWNKHGTCAAVLEPLNSEIKYFSKGLELLQNFTMTDILNEADIVPSNDKEYPLLAIHDAIKKKLEVNPAIECRKENGKNWLVEIRICFDKTLHLTDCNGILTELQILMTEPGVAETILSNCDASQGVFYPHYELPPNRLLVQLYNFVSWLQWFTL